MVSNYEKALQSFWDGECDIWVRETDINSKNGRNETREVLLHQKVPCRISFSNIAATGESNEAATIQQSVKLFLSKDIEIPPGSKVVVTQEGRSEEYKKSGQPAIYRYHQEVILEKFKEWA